jgi:hypothetical protein
LLCEYAFKNIYTFLYESYITISQGYGIKSSWLTFKLCCTSSLWLYVSKWVGIAFERTAPTYYVYTFGLLYNLKPWYAFWLVVSLSNLWGLYWDSPITLEDPFVFPMLFNISLCSRSFLYYSSVKLYLYDDSPLNGNE